MNTTQPGADVPAASPDGGQPAPRRIDCEPARKEAQPAPARGGGVRDPQEWRQTRGKRG